MLSYIFITCLCYEAVVAVCRNDDYIDLSMLRFTYINNFDESYIRFRSLSGNNYKLKIDCLNCINIIDRKLYCNYDTIINVTVEVRKDDIRYKVPFNISCSENSNTAKTYNIAATSDGQLTDLSWNVLGKSVKNFIIYRIGIKIQYEITETNKSYIELEDSGENCDYHVCIATIDNRQLTGPYKCETIEIGKFRICPVINFTAQSYDTSITLSWKRPHKSYNTPEGYNVTINDTSGNSLTEYLKLNMRNTDIPGSPWSIEVFELNKEAGSIRIFNLRPHSLYRIYISTVNGNRTACPVTIYCTTTEGKPVVPTNVNLINRSKSSLQFTWSSSTDLSIAGPTESYITKLMDSNYLLIKESSVTIRNVEFSNLKSCSQYCFQLYAVNKAGESGSSEIKCQYTLAPNPANVHLDDITSEYTSSKDISWTYKDEDNCPVRFTVAYRDIESNDLKHKNTINRRVTIDNLKKNMIYYFEVRAETNLDTEGGSKVAQYSEEKSLYTGIDKARVYKYKENIDMSRRRLNISWSFKTSQDGSIFEIIVIIKNSTKGLCLNLMNLVCRSCPPPYQLKNLKYIYLLERDTLLKCAKNEIIIYKKDDFKFNILFEMDRPLQNYIVEIYARNLLGIHKIHSSESEYNAGESLSFESINQSIITGTSTLVILLIIVTVLTVLLCKKFGKKHSIRKKTKTSLIAIEENSIMLPNTVQIRPMASDDKKKFRKYKSCNELSEKFCSVVVTELNGEYDDLILDSCNQEKDKGHTKSCGKAYVNRSKNRFLDIIPYDHNRVRIDGRRYPHDYINASFVPFVDDSDCSEYIASQGPIKETVSEYWTMVWQQRVSCIVMLTVADVDKKSNCLQYWPQNVGVVEVFGQKHEFMVTLLSQKEMSSYYERNLSISEKKTGITRRIIHLQMTSWPDHSAPELRSFDNFFTQFREITDTRKMNPYLIHCRSGVGRTGTFICIDRMIRQINTGYEYISVYDTVLDLMDCRYNIIQCLEQYVFIYEYIRHFLQKYYTKTG